MIFDRKSLEEVEIVRSFFMRELILQQISRDKNENNNQSPHTIPKNIVRYWHDPKNLPDDVRKCLESWEHLSSEGFTFHMFDDVTANKYIAQTYGKREQNAFARCGHPAMRCDYFRMCFLLAEGGLYVDADDVLIGDGWRHIFRNSLLKLQPLCYNITAGGMMPANDIWQLDLPAGEYNFYVNNDPIAAPSGHPVLQRALKRATSKLLNSDENPEIQSTTGPGNLTTSLAIHAWSLKCLNTPFDFELLNNWDSIAEMRWDLSYRNDERNWRNVFGC